MVPAGRMSKVFSGMVFGYTRAPNLPGEAGWLNLAQVYSSGLSAGSQQAGKRAARYRSNIVAEERKQELQA